jgi:hypothetical protein
MQQGAPNFFISVAYYRAAAPQAGGSFVLATVWGRIEQVPRPNPAYSRPVPQAVSAPAPWPTGLPTWLPPKPVSPAILNAPSAAPAVALPRKPALPAILASPPSPPPITINTTLQPVTVPVGSLQVAVGIIALAGGIGLFIVGFFVNLLFVGALVVFWTCGMWWLWLELARRRVKDELNREYKEELKSLRQTAYEQRRRWEQQLEAQQAEASRQYDREVKRWEAAVAAVRAEADRRRAEAERQHAVDVHRWEGATAAVRAEANRRRQGVEDARQRAEAGERHWAAAASRGVGEFDRKKRELHDLRGRHDVLHKQYATERQQLQARARELQLTGSSLFKAPIVRLAHLTPYE